MQNTTKFYAIYNTTSKSFNKVDTLLNHNVLFPSGVSADINEIKNQLLESIFNSPNEEFAIVEVTSEMKPTSLQPSEYKIVKDIALKFENARYTEFKNLNNFLSGKQNNRYLLFYKHEEYKQSNPYGIDQIFWLYFVDMEANIYGTYASDYETLILLKLKSDGHLIMIYDTDTMQWL